MNDINKILENWLEELSNFKFPNYENFPDIDLYMDQVVTYLEKNLQVLSTSSLDKIVTSSMINNYVKGEVITAPIQKKYNREHLALIEETCSLKQVLSIAEIKQILDTQYKDGNKASAFNEFKNLHSVEFDKAINECEEELKNIDKNDISKLTNLALELAVSANAKITISKRILFYLMKYEAIQKEKLEKEEKAKKDEEERLKKEEKQRKEEEKKELAQLKLVK